MVTHDIFHRDRFGHSNHVHDSLYDWSSCRKIMEVDIMTTITNVKLVKGFSANESIELVSQFLGKPVSDQKWEAVRKYISLDTRKPPAMKHDNYANVEYLLGAAACYVDYSKHYLKTFDRVHSKLGKISSALELGAGCGLTTTHLAQILPTAKIIYSNLPSVQFDFAKWLFKHQKIDNRVS